MRNCLRRRCRAPIILLALLCLQVAVTRGEPTAKISGRLFTIGTDQVLTAWSGARITIKNQKTQNAVSTVSNERGEFSQIVAAPGEYEVTAALAGFETEVRQIKAEPKVEQRLEIQLRPMKREERVVVKAVPDGVEIASTVAAGPTLSAEVIESVPLLDDHFENALPLIPGVVRGPDGAINIKGGRANQSSTLLNSASVADPVTGRPEIELPPSAVDSVRVVSDPFSAEYGGFAGGVVEVETRSGTDQWQFQLDGFVPRPRYRSGHILGIENITPRITASGPLVKGKLYLFHSTEYRFIRTKVPAQPDLRNDQVFEALEALTQLDWNITANHRLTATALVYPEFSQYLGLNTYDAIGSTASFRRFGYFISLRERTILSSGGFLDSSFSVKRLQDHFYPAQLSPEEFTIYPEMNSGRWYSTQHRISHLYQESQTYHLRPVQAHGTHLFEAGYLYAHSDYSGLVNNTPLQVLREDRTLIESITFAAPALLAASKNEFGLFVQDRWQIHHRFTLDAGARVDRDSLSRDAVNVAPRLGFVYAPGHDNKTAVRGGAGIFYDKIPLDVATFRAYPAETVTLFGADGTTIADGPVTFVHVTPTADGQLHVPYSLGTNVQVDREIRHGLLVRFGYEQRKTHRDILVNPVETGDTAALDLLGSGRQSYREFQWTVRWEPLEHTLIFSSFTRSRATGDLNGFDQFFGGVPNAIVRPNERDVLPYDAPNRILLWGYVNIPLGFQFSPVLEIRSGFPYSKVDANLDYIGPRDGAGRFPTFGALDTQLMRSFLIHTKRRTIRAKPAISIFNVTNHFNPRDVQQNVFSPEFGQFNNSVMRQFRFKIDFEFTGKS